jgi:hypothetical protein
VDGRGATEHGDFDPAEFADFLEADDAPIPADPAFRERLRQELWGMVRSQAERKRTLQGLPRPGPKRPS